MGTHMQKNVKTAGTSSYQNTYFDMKKNSNYVSYLFRQKTSELAYATKVVKPGTKLFQLQVEFSYLLHEMQQGYVYRRNAIYNAILDFIDKMDVSVPAK